MTEETETTQKTGGALLVSALIEQGVSTVFGIPGIQLDPLFDAFYRAQEDIAVVVPRHEQSTTYMADGYSRITGTPGVALVVPGPGVLNALSGLATAYARSSAVLLLAGHIASDAIGAERGVLHEIRDQSAVSEGVVAWVERAQTPEQLPELVARAFEFMTGPGGGPAVLELPADVLAALVEPNAAATPWAAQVPGSAPPTGAAEGRETSSGERSLQQSEALNTALQLLLEAELPMIYAGGGAISLAARRALAALAERLGAPVVMSENGKGAIPGSHPLAFERPSFSRLRDRADLALIVGSRARSQSSGELLTMPEKVVRIDVDERRACSEFEGGVRLVGDSAVVLAQLLDALPSELPERAGFGETELEGVRAEAAEQLSAIAPQLELLGAIRAATAPGTPIVAEYTQLGYASNIGMSIEQPRELVWPGYQGTLGYGFATALGAAYGNGAPLVCVTGDGGFSWTLSDLSTAVKYQIPLITIVVNDGFYGNVRRIQKEAFGERYIGTDLCNPDYQQLAAAFGLASARVHDAEELGVAVRTAFESGEPWLIELVASEFPSPWVIPLGD